MKKTEMIDVANKKRTRRLARARGMVRLNKELIKKIQGDLLPKGNVLENARIAAIMGVKNTAGLIPLCHNIQLDYAGVDFLFKKDGIIVESLIKSTGKTGVEMEAMVACAIAALTIYDMCKMFSKDITIERIFLLEKRGGKSGLYKKGGVE